MFIYTLYIYYIPGDDSAHAVRAQPGVDAVVGKRQHEEGDDDGGESRVEYLSMGKLSFHAIFPSLKLIFPSLELIFPLFGMG